MRRRLREIGGLGPLVLIGGMLRDLALFGNADFKSDLDFVIDPLDCDEFERRMNRIGASVNRFGGYSLPVNRWRIDIWPLQKTWAYASGHVVVKKFEDLKKITFFDCDAIIYSLEDGTLSTASGYFDQLKNRVLEINLRPNPNPEGNAVRAFRYAIKKGFVWGPELTNFVAEILENIGWDGLSDREKRSFNSSYIASLDHHEFEVELRRYLSGRSGLPFGRNLHHRDLQLEFPFVR